MNLKVRWLIFLCSISCLSCNFKKSLFSEILKSIDTVKIQRFTSSDTLSILATDKGDIDIFKNIINGRQEDIPTCVKTGRIIFYSKGKPILDVSQFNEVIEYSLNNTIY